jgi:hypothetical protein
MERPGLAHRHTDVCVLVASFEQGDLSKHELPQQIERKRGLQPAVMVQKARCADPYVEASHEIIRRQATEYQSGI